MLWLRLLNSTIALGPANIIGGCLSLPLLLLEEIDVNVNQILNKEWVHSTLQYCNVSCLLLFPLLETMNSPRHSHDHLFLRIL